MILHFVYFLLLWLLTFIVVVTDSQCLEEHVRLAESATVNCPFNNGDYACASMILDREIKAVSFHLYS